MDENKRIVFTEINQHLRSTEQKFLMISAAFLGFYFSTLLIIFGKIDLIRFTPNIMQIILCLILLAAGMAVNALQHWYRSWKEHYIEIINKIAQSWELKECYFPYWMRSQKTSKTHPTLDNLLYHFVLYVNIFMMLLLCYAIYRITDNVALPITIVFAFLVINMYIRKTFNKNNFLKA